MLEIDPLVLFGLAMVTGPLVGRAPWAIALVAVVAAACAARRGRAALLIVTGLAVGQVRATRAVEAHQTAMRAIDEVARPARAGPWRCGGRGIVAASPLMVRDSLRLTIDFSALTCDEGALPPLRAVVYAPLDGETLARGDAVDVIAQLAPPERFANPEIGDGVFSRARSHVARSGGALFVRVVSQGRGPLALIDRARAHVRARIVATFAPETAPFARALVLGETDLDPRDDLAFRTSGLAHLLAVSGMHLVIVVLGLVRAIESVLRRVVALAAHTDVGRAAAWIGIGWSWAYADFAGGSGSALRAAWMLTFALLARALSRRGDGARSFALSLVAMSIVDPLVVADVSFVLSVAATGGLLVFARPLSRVVERLLGRNAAPPLRYAWEGIATTLAATIPCAPVLARFAPTLPLGGVAANLLAVPLGEGAALPVCILHAFLAPWPAAERGAATVASGALVLVRWLARSFGEARWLALPVPPPTSIELGLLAAGAVAALATRGWSRNAILIVTALALTALEGHARRDGAPHGLLRATFLDVGQGDAALVDLPDGSAVLIDGGGLVGSPVDVGERVIAPVLRARRRSRLAAVLLSHPHPDHFGGFARGLAAVSFDEAWDTGQGEREGVSMGYAAWLVRAREVGARVLRPDALCGAPRTIGGATFEVLAPCPAPVSDRGPNDNSLVVRISFGSRSMLFVGDAEHEEEVDLARLPAPRLHADLLKVGHHGSRTSSSSAFLARVAPREAVISVGVRNRFGHPAPSTLDALSALGVRVHRTDREGAIVATTDGDALTVAAEGGGDL